MKRGVGTFCGYVEYIKEGIGYSELEDHTYIIKDESTGGEVETRKDGPVDVTKLFVDQINKNNVDAIWSSSHASEHDFAGFRHNKETGRIVSQEGKLIAIDISGKRYEINSTNPKVYTPCGNCLIGHISDKNCMALAWIHSGGVCQFMGYTVET